MGIIIPIHKDGKPRTEPKSYRPISLLPVFYKLFDKVLNVRLVKWGTLTHKQFPNKQQNAYQKQLGSLTTSFNLQEAVWHGIELGSEVYAAFLDTADAFDNVRNNALFVKIKDELGIHGKTLRLIINSYTDISAYVIVNGGKSEQFPVLQSCR